MDNEDDDVVGSENEIVEVDLPSENKNNLVPIWERLPERADMRHGFLVKLCRLTHCQDSHYAKGLCNKHYHLARQGRLDPENGSSFRVGRPAGSTNYKEENLENVNLSQMGSVDKWVYIAQTQEFIKKSDGMKLLMPAAITANGTIVKALVRNHKFKVYDSFKFQVYNPENGLPEEDSYYNTFHPSKLMWARGGATGSMSEPLQTLFNTIAPHDEDYRYLERWLAWMFRNPGEVGCSVILRGVHGSGKSTLASLMQTIFGPYTATIRTTDIENSFNSWLEDKLFVSCEEMAVGSSNQQIRTMNELKKYISGGQITINRKGVPQYPFTCCARWMIFSNAKIPMIMESTERRYSVIEGFTKLPETIGKELFANRKKYAQELLDRLHTIDISDMTAWTQLDNAAIQKIKADSEVYFI